MLFLADTKKQAVAQYLFGTKQPLFFLAILMGQSHFCMDIQKLHTVVNDILALYDCPMKQSSERNQSLILFRSPVGKHDFQKRRQ